MSDNEEDPIIGLRLEEAGSILGDLTVAVAKLATITSAIMTGSTGVARKNQMEMDQLLDGILRKFETAARRSGIEINER